MKSKSLLSLFLLSLAGVVAAQAATLGVTESNTTSGSLTSYTYVFTITGANAGIDTIFLGSNDLSPLNLAFTVDGVSTTNWSFLGNNSPQNYLEFFSTNGSSLNSGDTLGVTFKSIYSAGAGHFAIAENSTTTAVTNQLTSLVAPTSIAPEPATSALILLTGAALLVAGRVRAQRPAA